MSTAYCDSGILTKLYYKEPDSPRVIALIGGLTPPLPFTAWQELEVRNALRAKQFRKEMPDAQLATALANLQSDLDAGLLQRIVVDYAVVFRQAEVLSDRFTAAIGCRTLDILHVATAMAMGVDEFITFDVRQRSLARQAGLNVRRQP